MSLCQFVYMIWSFRDTCLYKHNAIIITFEFCHNYLESVLWSTFSIFCIKVTSNIPTSFFIFLGGALFLGFSLSCSKKSELLHIVFCDQSIYIIVDIVLSLFPLKNWSALLSFAAPIYNPHPHLQSFTLRLASIPTSSSYFFLMEFVETSLMFLSEGELLHIVFCDLFV